MSEFKWNDKMEALAQKHYTAKQLQDLRARPFTAADQERVGAAWAQVFAELNALGPNPDPASPLALDIGARAQALINEFTQGDPALYRAVTGMKKEMMADAEIAARGPGTAANMAVLGAIFAELRKQG